MRTKEIFEKHSDIIGFLKNLRNCLEIDFWTDEDPDGKSGGVNITMEYDDEGLTLELLASEMPCSINSFKASLTTPCGFIEVPIPFTEEQLKVVRLWIDEQVQQEAEQLNDAAEYARDEYAYHGVSRSDFY